MRRLQVAEWARFVYTVRSAEACFISRVGDATFVIESRVYRKKRHFDGATIEGLSYLLTGYFLTAGAARLKLSKEVL